MSPRPTELNFWCVAVLCLLAVSFLGCELIDALVRGNPQPPPTKGFALKYSIAPATGSGSYSVPGAGSPPPNCDTGPLPPLQVAQMVQARSAQWDRLVECATAFDADLANINTDAAFPNLPGGGERLTLEVYGPSGDPVQLLRAETSVDVTQRNNVTQGSITIELANGDKFTCAQQNAGDPWHANPTPSGQFFELELDSRDPQAQELKAHFQCIGVQTTPPIPSPPLILVLDGDVFMDY